MQTNPPRFSAYVGSKAALDAFTRVVSSETIGDNVTFTTIHMPLVRTPMIAPTKMYDSFPTISPEEAADLVCEAIRAKPKQINTKLGTFGEVAYALAPKAVDQILHLAYRVFPESTAAKGGKGDARQRQGVGRGDRAGLSDEGRALVVLTAGGLRAAFAPEDGMACHSLKHQGEELLGAVRGPGVPDVPWISGIPLLHPWANRLGGFGYAFDGEVVALRPARPTSTSRSTGCRCTACARRSTAGRSSRPQRPAPRRRARLRRRRRVPVRPSPRGRRRAHRARADADDDADRGRAAGAHLLRLPPVLPAAGRAARGVGDHAARRRPAAARRALVPTGERVAGGRPRRPARRAPLRRRASRSTSCAGRSCCRAAGGGSRSRSSPAIPTRRSSRRRSPTSSASSR